MRDHGGRGGGPGNAAAFAANFALTGKLPLKWQVCSERMAARTMSAYRVVFLGPPGAGKGSQANFVVDKFDLVHISTGDLLRDAVAKETPTGRQAGEIMAAGSLVPDHLVLQLITDFLDECDASIGFLLDGFPRTIGQARSLREVLERIGRPLDFVVHLHVDDEELVKRLSGRRTCANCNAIYNIYYMPPKTPEVCDQCGRAELAQRADDNEESIRNRLSVYNDQTKPLLDFYDGLELLRTVDASGSINEIAERVMHIFETAT